MNTQSKLIFSLFLITAVLIGVSAFATPANAVGSTSLQDIINAESPVGGTIPLSSDTGAMSVKWTNVAGGDTQYDDTTTTTNTEIDTGYDLTPGIDVDDADGNKSLSAGDSVVWTIPVTNTSNNGNPIPVTFRISMDSGVANSFDTDLYWDWNGNSTYENGVDSPFNPTGADSDVYLTEDGQTHIFAVITAQAVASNGDTIGHRLFISDNAPVHGGDLTSSTGDGWENGTPISGNDQNDTQNVFFRTTVSGPVLNISKSFTGVTQDNGGNYLYRPGDTVVYTIAVRNTGAGTAANVAVHEAIPDSTTYVVGSVETANDNLYGNTLSDTAFSADGIDGDYEVTSGGDAGADAIKWTIDSIGPDGNSNDSVALDFKVTID